MNNDRFINELNPLQKDAVTAPLGNQLVLAGAGSGKTKVLTARICYLIKQHNVKIYNILALTFTNKAAREMKERVAKNLLELGINASNFAQIGTFHSICIRMLRQNFKEADLDRDFQILDQSDQMALAKRLIKDNQLDDDIFKVKDLVYYINNKKEAGFYPSDLKANSDNSYTYDNEKNAIWFYGLYQQACQRANLVDFAEILLRCFIMLQKYPTLLQRFQNQFKHILVDEFQDTNDIQYRWLKLLSANSFVMAVGDDDQSIYSWRGARAGNLQTFLTDYAPVKLTKLEQNYRSSAIILQAANQLISENSERLGKNLWTQEDGGEKIDLYKAFNELDEARFIVNEIKKSKKKLSDFTILYRNNAQSRNLEEALLGQAISYKIYGTTGFYQRLEIKNVMAYLRLVFNKNDDISFERVVNFPKRGVGISSIDKLKAYSNSLEISLWEGLERLCLNNEINLKLNNLIKFYDIVNQLTKEAENLGLADLIKYTINITQIVEEFKKNKDKHEEREENLNELINAGASFVKNEEEQELTDLGAFLGRVSIESSDVKNEQTEQDHVKLMTIHGAKGLEFERVFMVGLEEGLFPSQSNSFDPTALEEERRLAYVGITRAKKYLCLCYANERRNYGKIERNLASRFIAEIGNKNIRELTARGKIQNLNFTQNEHNQLKQNNSSLTTDAKWKAGVKVLHAKYGQGTIIRTEGDGTNIRAQIAFVNQGVKWLMPNIAKLEII